jgi:hypothetical protein
VRGNASGQFQKIPQPDFLLVGKVRAPYPVLHPAQHRAEDYHQNILEFVGLVPRLPARIGPVGKIRARVERLGPHQVPPSARYPGNPSPANPPHGVIALALTLDLLYRVGRSRYDVELISYLNAVDRQSLLSPSVDDSKVPP